MNPEQKYDVVIDVLQKHHDKLRNMIPGDGLEWGIMDFIRLEQMEELQNAMNIWKKHKPQENDDE